MQVKIRDLERHVGDMAKNINQKSIYNLTNMDTKSPFIKEITDIVSGVMMHCTGPSGVYVLYIGSIGWYLLGP